MEYLTLVVVVVRSFVVKLSRHSWNFSYCATGIRNTEKSEQNLSCALNPNSEHN